VARPAVAVGVTRLHILGPDATTSRGYLYGANSGNHSKAVDGSGLSFTADMLEAAMAADPSMLDDAFAVVELNTGTLASPVWTPIATPFLLAPGSGNVVGSSERSDETPVATGALHGLASELIVLPTECDDDSPTLRLAGGLEQNRYLGFQAKGYSESLHSGEWHDADVYDPTGQPKEDQPEGWDAAAAGAEWVFRDADEGGLTVGRVGTFTLSERTTVKFIASCDEEGKVFLDGPNQGGVILQISGDETGYTEKNSRRLRLEPGTYLVSFDFTTVGSVGGDGNDSLRFACGPVDTGGNMASVLLMTDGDTRVHRQGKTLERLGMSPMEVVRRLLDVNSDLGVDAADILLDDKTFTDALDSDDEAPSEEDCREWVWPLGTPLASVLADMSEDADFDLSPDFEFGCWLDRGADLSASVALVKGGPTPSASMNVLEYGYDSEPIGPTRYLTLSQDGFDIVVGTSAESGTRPRFGYFESGASASIGRAKQNARAAIRQNGRLRRFYRAKIIAVAGCVPYVDFTLCDVISGLDYEGNSVDLEVTDIAWETHEGTTLFTLSLGEL
jgi:hypothetical protein